MSEDNSTKAITGAQSGGLNIIVVALLLLLAVVLGWYIGQSGAKPRDINFLPPASGVLDYYLSVNDAGEPTPYAPTAKAFTPCIENCYEDVLSEANRAQVDALLSNIKQSTNLDLNAYLVLEAGEKSGIDQKQSSVPFVEKAHAAASGCYVVMVYQIGGTRTYIYNKPGCP